MDAVDAERVIERMELEIRPLLDEDKYHGGYDCCGCSTYDDILDHAIRVVREASIAEAGSASER